MLSRFFGKKEKPSEEPEISDTVKYAVETLRKCSPNMVEFLKFINDEHLPYVLDKINKNLITPAKYEIFEKNTGIKETTKDLKEYSTLLKKYKENINRKLYNICDNILKNPEKYVFGSNFYDDDDDDKKLIGKTFKYVDGLYHSDVKKENGIPDSLIKLRILDFNPNMFDHTRYKTFTLIKIEDNFITFILDNDTNKEIIFRKIPRPNMYPGNSIYGHIFEQIEDEPTDAKSQPSEEPSTGGKRTRRKNRRRRHQKSRKNRKSRRRI